MRLLLTNLDTCLLQSTIGEFSRRLDMLRVFQRHLKMVSLNQLLENLLTNTIDFYTQYEELVKNQVQLIRKPIQKELEEYVQIASWKDVNVFALRESAKRTHYHMNKFLKKFKLGLSASVAPLLQKHLETTRPVDAQSGSMESVLDNIKSVPVLEFALPSTFELGGRLAQIPSYSQKMQSLRMSFAQTDNTLQFSLDLDDLAASILDRIQEFQTINNSITNKDEEGEQSKTAYKGQRMIRKKALTDLLKTLQEFGFAPRGLTRFQSNADIYTVLSQSPFSPHFDQTKVVGVELLKRTSDYFYKNTARLSILRRLAQTSFSPEVSIQEVEKMCSFTEHLYSLSLEAKKRQVSLDELLKWFSSLEWLSESNDDEEMLVLFQEPCKCFMETLQGLLFDLLRSQDVLVESQLPTLDGLSTLVSLKESLCNTLLQFHHWIAPATMLKDFSSVICCVLDLKESLGQLAMKTLLESSVYTNMSQTLDSGLVTLTACYSNLQGCATIPNQDDATHGLMSQGESLVDLLLVSFQELRLEIKGETVLDAHAALVSLFERDRLAQLQEKLVDLLTLGKQTPKQLQQLLLLVKPLVWNVLEAYQFRTLESLSLQKSLGKLNYILCNTFCELLRNGYCIPEEIGEDQDDQQGDELNEGTGLADGTGQKDISDQIKDPEELDGIQNESTEKQEPGPQDGKEAIEMENDFDDGELEDVPNEGDDDDEQDNDQDQDDEQMGELDQELADVVDEKLWDEEKDEKNPNEEEKVEENASGPSGPQETETVAQEGDSQENDQGEQPKEQESKESTEEQDQIEDQEGGDVNQVPEMEESHHIDLEQQQQEQPMDEEDMELPQDMDLDQMGDDMDADEPMQEEPQMDEMDELNQDTGMENSCSCF